MPLEAINKELSRHESNSQQAIIKGHGKQIVALRVRKYRGVVYGKMCTPIGLLEGFPDSDRAEAKRHNNTHSGEACDPLEPDLWHLSGKGS